MKINTNLSSLIVQSSLKASTNGLNTAIERMTTGFKINHAKDNAANYSINTKLSSKLSSYYVAQDNASMGLDMMTSAMDNLDLISSHLSRMRDLAEQAANGTYGEDSLKAIQSEINARLEECSRIIENSEYNGIKLFQGTEGLNGKFLEEIKPLTEQEAIAQGYTVIKTADELQAMENNVNGKYILMNDIDLAGYSWTAVGTSSDVFSGEFNGNGYVIKNLTVNQSGLDYQGLFGRVSHAKISNVGLENVEVKGNTGTGALAGYTDNSDFRNCYVDGVSISGGLATGGLTGTLDGGGIQSCYIINGSVTSSSFNVGGLVGDANSGIMDSYSTVDVTGNQRVGGLAGSFSMGSIKNCYSTGNVSAVRDTAGGFVGNLNGGTLSSCYTTSLVNSGDPAKMGAFTGVLSIGNINVSFANCHYYSSYNPGMAAVGYNPNNKDTSGLTDGGTLPEPVIPNIISFQVGIYSDSSSRFALDLEFTLDLKINASDANSARNALTNIDNLLAKINTRQTEFGAAYNRLESALETIGVNIENLTSTQSTIRDADIAEESSAYIRNQILQQASATLLATANQTPAIALQLL